MSKDPSSATAQPVLRDIEAPNLGEMAWSPDGAAASLQATAKYATDYADASGAWYLRHKRSKRIGARCLRVLVILLFAAAGVLPMVQQVFTTSDGKAPFPPAWASIVLAAGVLLIGLDHFFGFSSGWIRYVLAEAQIRRRRQEFDLDWQSLLAGWAGKAPSVEQVQHALAQVRAFVDDVNGVIGDETSHWVAEFQESLKQVEEQSRAAQPSPVEMGSLTVTVKNGDAVAPPGWTMAIDHGSPAQYTGKTAAVLGLTPGPHAVRVKGSIKGSEARAETIASIRAGVLTAVDLDLA